MRNCPICKCVRRLEKSFLFASVNVSGKEAKPQGRSKFRLHRTRKQEKTDRQTDRQKDKKRNTREREIKTERRIEDGRMGGQEGQKDGSMEEGKEGDIAFM